jgi:hypothetical protein
MQNILNVLIQHIEENVLEYTQELYDWNLRSMFLGWAIFVSFGIIMVILVLTLFYSIQERVSYV